MSILLALIAAPICNAEVLSILIEGDLDPETRVALSKVFSPGSVESIIRTKNKSITTLEDLCNNDACVVPNSSIGTSSLHKEIRLAQQEISAQNAQFPTNWPVTVPIIQVKRGLIPKVTRSKVNFLVFPAESSVLAGFDIDSDSSAVAVSVDEDAYNQALRTSLMVSVLNDSEWTKGQTGVLAASAEKSHEIEKIQQDIKTSGYSVRQFEIPPGTSKKHIEALKRLASSDESKKIEQSLDFKSDLVWPEQAVTFLADSDDCRGESPDWSYNAAEIVETLNDNFLQFEAVGVTKFDATSVLILDTGIGPALLQDTNVAAFVAPILPDLLYADTYWTDLSLDDKRKICLDPASLNDEAVPYGFSAMGQFDDCKSIPSIERIYPIAKKAGDRTGYAPEHGSFVSVLALGGEHIFSQVPRLNELIGLKFARITKPASSTNQSVYTEISDLIASLKFADKIGVDIVNASISIDDPRYQNIIRNALDDYSGMLVAAAGNNPIELKSTMVSYPANHTGKLKQSGSLMVVGAIGRTMEGKFTLWPNSTFSPTYVDLAAPGDRVLSMNEKGERVCMSGTSAAAPLVTFVSAVLKAYGITQAVEIKRRILATASVQADLQTHFAYGSVLDPVAALDVFSDLIWFHDNPNPVRGRLVDFDNTPETPIMLQLCDEGDGVLKPAGGLIDPAILLLWRSGVDSGAEIWHRRGGANPSGEICKFSEQEIRFYNSETRETRSFPLVDLDRIVPSPFRGVMK